jgi:signal transduction histidine kinase
MGDAVVIDLLEESNRSAVAPSKRPTTEIGNVLDNVTGSFLHDLRNPLTAIRACAEMLLRENLRPADTRRLTLNMYRAADRMRELIAEFVCLAQRCNQIEENRNLRMLLTESCTAAGTPERDAIEILLDVPTQLDIPVSPARMKSVFVNLIANAAEAMPDGGVIRITATEAPDRVRIEVEDTGPGIPAEIRGRLFEPFVTANKSDGLGLGLSLSRQTVRELGGDLWAEPAAGARFVIWLPLARQLAPVYLRRRTE